jgi:hypothetical protein
MASFIINNRKNDEVLYFVCPRNWKSPHEENVEFT